MENKHYKNQVLLWITLGFLSYDDLIELAGQAYEQEQKQDAMTDEH